MAKVIIAEDKSPARRDRTAPYAYILVVAFAVTYLLVMFSERLGIAPPTPRTAAVTSTSTPSANPSN